MDPEFADHSSAVLNRAQRSTSEAEHELTGLSNKIPILSQPNKQECPSLAPEKHRAGSNRD
jgi:hypothetical protein